MKQVHLYFVVLALLLCTRCIAQEDNNKKTKQYKNIIRYDLSGALLFGIDSYIVFGYERVISPHQSFSVNIGRVALPKIFSINTENFSIDKDQERSGFNTSIDYRFYLAKENKYIAPHGVYIGPYYSYNKFTNERQWRYKNDPSAYVESRSGLTINTTGIEVGYQFILFKRLALDLAMFGPGIGFYNYKVRFDGNIDADTQKELFSGLKELLIQKFPGMNHVFSDKEFNASGVMKTNSLGYRFIIHIGFAF